MLDEEKKKETDECLAEKSKNGDQIAFSILLNRYSNQIYNFVRQYTRQKEDAEDIAQDAFFKAWKHIKLFKKGKMFRPWIYAIARNTALDYVKKKKAIFFSELDDAENDLAFADTLSDQAPLPPEVFDRIQLREELEVSLGSLHPDHRSVLILHYQDDMTFEDIADVMDTPMNTVKSWHRRALIKLNNILKNKPSFHNRHK